MSRYQQLMMIKNGIHARDNSTFSIMFCATRPTQAQTHTRILLHFLTHCMDGLGEKQPRHSAQRRFAAGRPPQTGSRQDTHLTGQDQPVTGCVVVPTMAHTVCATLPAAHNTVWLGTVLAQTHRWEEGPPSYQHNHNKRPPSLVCLELQESLPFRVRP